MLKKRLIPKLLLKNTKNNTPCLVNSFKYSKYKIIGSPISQAKIFEAQHADQLILLNIESVKLVASSPMINLLEDFSSNIFMPLTFGGGIKSEKCVELALKHGADKVSINTEAVNNKNLIKKTSKLFGKQCIVVAIDYKHNGSFYEVFVNGGKKKTGINLYKWVKEIEELGAGVIMISDIERDGSGKGLNIEVSKKVSDEIKIPVIASAGCGLAEHFVECFSKTKVQGIAAGNFFSFKDQNVFQTRSQIINRNIPLRKV